MKLYKVKGNSMYPLITEDDMVMGKETPFDSLVKGNIVIFKKETDYIIHRIINRDKSGVFYVRGDGYSLPIEAVDKKDIMGKVVAIIKGEKFLPLTRFREWSSWVIATVKAFLKNLVFLQGRLLKHR